VISWTFACPICRGALATGVETLYCSACRERYDCRDGIWQFLPARRRKFYGQFLQEYRAVRVQEGWGRPDPAYHRSLPRVSRDDPQRTIWLIRERTFRLLLDRVVAPMERSHSGKLQILDVGAGNCWLTFRLAERGHRVAAVDISRDAADGLGAHVHYEPVGEDVTLAQAEFDRLPFAGEQANLVIFNGSIHYARDFAMTLDETARVLRPDGRVVIMDSPVYRSAGSGLHMIRQREDEYERRYGFPSDALPMEGFLTWKRLDQVGVAVALTWTVIHPSLGLRVSARRWKASVLQRSEPARFPIIVGARQAQFRPASLAARSSRLR
jgi:SAM-dependent methyltransferase